MTRTLSTLFQWIAKKAGKPDYVYRSLAHHLTPELLHLSFKKLNKKASGGIDKQTVGEFERQLDHQIKGLHERLVEQRYKALPVKRVWIPKEGGKKRPLGLPTVADKVVQGAVKMLLEPIYEKEFYDFSYGYRPGKSCHQALESLWQQTMKLKTVWMIDADISDYFGTIDHKHLREFIKRKVVDGNIIKLIGKWLNAGVLEEGRYFCPEHGTPQGGVISPLLANIYLHYVLDEWFVKEVQPRLKGRSFLIRFADDFVIGCEGERDAQKVMAVLGKRMEKYGLKLQPDKTRLINFRRPKPTAKKGEAVFDFLGFRHYWGRSRYGRWYVRRKTAPNKIKRTMRAITDWCRLNRHKPMLEQHETLCRKLRGHYNYYGLTSNFKALTRVLRWTERQWFKWFNRRGGKHMKWDKFRKVLLQKYILSQPRVVHSMMPKPQAANVVA